MIIRSVASALPSRCYDSGTVAAWCGSDERFLCEKVGIAFRHFLEEGESEIDLACLACEKLFEQAPGLSKSDIGVCIYVGQVRTQIIPHASALLQDRLNLPRTCACFDLGLACSGYPYGLTVAKSFMESRKTDQALLITCDPYSKIIQKTNRATAPLFGDAATATWLSLDGPGLEVGKADLGTDGSGAAYLEFSPHERGKELYMDGKGIFNFALRQVPLSVYQCLELNKKLKEDIDYFLFHQANAFIVRNLCSVMNIDEKKCPIHMQNVANTVSSSIPLLLEEFLPRLHKAEQIIMSGFGGGLSWGTTYAQFRGEPNE